jgi:penicillin-insensitive murein endopeptidase
MWMGFLWLGMAGPVAAGGAAWASFTSPALGSARPIGSYDNGCLVGGQMLPSRGRGYQVVRLSQRRYYGHPETIAYIEDLAAQVAAEGLGRLVVGDIAMPRGGPFRTGHRSHQNGLDVDLWLELDVPPLGGRAGERREPRSMVRGDEIDRALWSDRQAELLRLAASDPRVSRIFVHPVIKRELCERRWPDRSWLQVVRPWYGHRAHLHVRLNCPPGAPDCEPQKPIPPGDGCGAELASWFEPPSGAPSRPKPRVTRPLPAACQALLAGDL